MTICFSQVSPGVKQLVESFDRLVRDPTCVYSVAGLARILGERRLCKLEVELMTLCHYVYCVEHEPLQTVLSHITSMVCGSGNRGGWWLGTGSSGTGSTGTYLSLQCMVYNGILYKHEKKCSFFSSLLLARGVVQPFN